MSEFIRELSQALMRLSSGLEPRRRTQGGTGSKTDYCLSKSERRLVKPMYARTAVTELPVALLTSRLVRRASALE